MKTLNKYIDEYYSVSLEEGLRLNINDKPEDSILEDAFNNNDNNLLINNMNDKPCDFTNDSIGIDDICAILYTRIPYGDYENAKTDVRDTLIKIIDNYYNSFEIKIYKQSKLSLDILKSLNDHDLLDTTHKRYKISQFLYYIGPDYSYINYSLSSKLSINWSSSNWEIIVKRL